MTTIFSSRYNNNSIQCQKGLMRALTRSRRSVTI